MDDERLFDDDLTPAEAAELRARSEPATIVHSKDEYERAKATALVRAAASWTEAAVIPGAALNEAADINVLITESSPAVVSEQTTLNTRESHRPPM